MGWWWGKVIGGTVGFLMGGPLGAVLGASVGHGYDTFQENESPRVPGDTERIQAVFFTATFSVMGHLARSDGRVSEEEIASVKDIMFHMRLTAEQKQAAINLFRRGKRRDFPLDAILDQFRDECRGREDLFRLFFEMLLATAMADGDLHETERRVLDHIRRRIDYPEAAFERILQSMKAHRNRHRERPGGAPPELDDAYRVLGLPKTASDDELKAAYRSLIMSYHPDTLVSKGLPEEMMQFATEKTRMIKSAYDQIRTSRNLH